MMCRCSCSSVLAWLSYAIEQTVVAVVFLGKVRLCGFAGNSDSNLNLSEECFFNIYRRIFC